MGARNPIHCTNDDLQLLRRPIVGAPAPVVPAAIDDPTIRLGGTAATGNVPVFLLYLVRRRPDRVFLFSVPSLEHSPRSKCLESSGL